MDADVLSFAPFAVKVFLFAALASLALKSSCGVNGYAPIRDTTSGATSSFIKSGCAFWRIFGLVLKLFYSFNYLD